MIKFTADMNGGRKLIGIGLTAGNIERLKQGKPIHISLEEMGLPWRADIGILYGETEDSLREELSEFITEKTVIHEERGRKTQ